VTEEELTLSERVHANPPIWKDWVGFAGMVVTVSLVFIQGGRILESLDNTRAELNKIVGVVTVLKDDMAMARTELARQQGVDALHEANMRALDARMVILERANPPHVDPRR
jgi:hypothetical protein